MLSEPTHITMCTCETVCAHDHGYDVLCCLVRRDTKTSFRSFQNFTKTTWKRLRGGWVVWLGRVVQMIHDMASLSWRMRMMQLFRVAEHLGASSRRRRHPFPALMAGEPLAVYLCTRPKKAFPSHHELQLRRPPQFSARLDSLP